MGCAVNKLDDDKCDTCWYANIPENSTWHDDPYCVKPCPTCTHYLKDRWKPIDTPAEKERLQADADRKDAASELVRRGADRAKAIKEGKDSGKCRTCERLGPRGCTFCAERYALVSHYKSLTPAGAANPVRQRAVDDGKGEGKCSTCEHLGVGEGSYACNDMFTRGGSGPYSPGACDYCSETHPPTQNYVAMDPAVAKAQDNTYDDYISGRPGDWWGG